MRIIFLILASCACATTPYYSGEHPPEVSRPVDVAESCRDSEGLAYGVGQKKGDEICTVDRKFQRAYCIHPESELPFSVTAKNIRIGNNSASCVRARTAHTGATWVEPAKAKAAAVKSLQAAESIACDYLEFRPYYKYEIDLKRRVLDIHGGFTHLYELPIAWSPTRSGGLHIKVESDESDLLLEFGYGDTSDSRGYEYFGKKSDSGGNGPIYCSIVK